MIYARLMPGRFLFLARPFTVALPPLIEISPLSTCPDVELVIPGSKSITNRALVLAALGDGRTILHGALWSEDTQVMTESLARLGFSIRVEPDSSEPANRTITVEGKGGIIPNAGTETSPLDLAVANAGTAARFLAALVCLGNGYYRLTGVARMHDRPQAELLAALRQLGYQVLTPNDRLPVVVRGGGPRPGAHCRVSLEESSQFASALLLVAFRGGWKVEVEGRGDADDAPYVAMTERLVEVFPFGGGDFSIEPDASSASYFWAAGWLCRPGSQWLPTGSNVSESVTTPRSFPVRIRNWPTSRWQIDADFPRFLPLPAQVSREHHLGDSILTAMVVAAASESPETVTFTHLGRLRVQECERVAAMKTELMRCGATVMESGDSLRIESSVRHGAILETYHDHRMAMCWATMGLRIPGIQIRHPDCVRKTFPNFFCKLAAPPPLGLGVAIWECNPSTGDRLCRRTNPEDLFAA